MTYCIIETCMLTSEEYNFPFGVSLSVYSLLDTCLLYLLLNLKPNIWYESNLKDEHRKRLKTENIEEDKYWTC